MVKLLLQVFPAESTGANHLMQVTSEKEISIFGNELEQEF